MTDWEQKLRAWAPELRLQVVSGAKEVRQVQWASQAHVHLATYDSLRQDSEVVPPRTFDLVITDEVQKIKNPETGIAQAVRRLNPPVRWGLSGTPLENRIDDLFAVFAFLAPGLLQAREAGRPDRVREAMAPFLLRRRKSEALKELPEKVVGEAWVELTESQRAAYDELEQRGILDLKEKGEKVTVTHIFGLINHLKQICNIDPVTGESSKLDFLGQRMEHIAEQGDKALVFSQFPEKTLRKAAEFLNEYGAQIYDGSLSGQQRDHVVEAFRRDPARVVLLLSTKAGGLGLTLTEANYVFHLDHWWNPAAAAQAEDRTHRIGQKKQVFVQYVYAVDTIEERIRKLVEQKRRLFKEIIDELTDVELSGRLTEDELFELFGLERPRGRSQTNQQAMPTTGPRTAYVDARTVLTDLELALRRIIEAKLSQLTSDWWVERVPNDIRMRAEGRRARNESAWPWLSPKTGSFVDFLDFSDYRKIISIDTNWGDVFEKVFLHREIVVAKMMELEPIRNNVAHNRELSAEELQVLRLNSRHLMLLLESSR